MILLITLHPSLSAQPAQETIKPPTGAPAVIVIVDVLGETYLIRPEKSRGRTHRLPNGQWVAELPRPSEYYAGTLYQLRIEKVFKGKKLVRSGETITLLIPGRRVSHHGVKLSAHRKYLLKLSILEDAEKYKGTVVSDRASALEGKPLFDPHNVFEVFAPLFNTAILVTDENKKLIKREAKK